MLTLTLLQPNLCYAKQDREKVNLLRCKVLLPLNQYSTILTLFKMLDKFPILDNYDKMWPLNLILISLLKYQTGKNKGASVRDAVAFIQNRGD
jgi:hypothetical protein